MLVYHKYKMYHLEEVPEVPEPVVLHKKKKLLKKKRKQVKKLKLIWEECSEMTVMMMMTVTVTAPVIDQMKCKNELYIYIFLN